MVALATSKSSLIIENQEDKNDKTAITPAQASPFSTLPVEILPIIFQFAAGSNQPKDLKTLLNMRLVCKQWKDVMHNKSVLNTYWKIIKNIPYFQPPSIYAQQIEESEKPPARPEISAADQNSALWKFKNFSTALGISRALILPCDYEQYLHLLDESLKKIWSKIQKKIYFAGDPVPQEAQEIRSWLNDSANISALARITELDLSNLKLEVLPPEIDNLFKLRELYLDNNQLTALPVTIRNLGKSWRFSFWGLSLNNNQLTTLPDAISDLKELSKLSLSSNQLRILPDAIGNLKELGELNLNNNQLTALPDAIGNLKELKWLHLNSNQLTTLPDAIGNLEELEKLRLSNNQLTTLPDTIGNLKALRELHLDSALFTTLPSTLSNLESLQWIFLDDTRCMFILDKALSRFDSEASTNRNKYVGFRFYECPPPLAAFCRTISLLKDRATLQEQFSQLSSETQNELTQHGLGKLNLPWGCYETFRRTLAEMLKAKCNGFTKEEKEQFIQEKVWELAAEAKETGPF